ncbi:glycosyltransferase family 39 protein [Peterkaempfera bronchialis]|uniref:Glycosyltransferase RgtA/B/C/D-like domain-containing protein n=1 Tax=Peterkaempfera bronchialis TaxID=2126346 RepID=A0A345SWL1_9ACTN|nr:glycosyltransferase family 39 protein [Peterkaempfera bronchialis]AXI78116.1 hypothetical protein C7M71_012355 [Peterkaempfera bronchialis]
MALVPAVVMLAVGFWGLDRGSMWRDEEATFEVSQRTVPQILAMVRHLDAVHAVYYLVMHGWMRLGGGEVWMRVPSVLGMGAAAGLVALLGARLARPRVGLFAGLMFAAVPLVTYYAQEGRSYALVCAVVLLASYCLVRAVETGGRWWWWGYTASVAFAALLHEFAVLALVAHAGTLLLSRVEWRVWRRWLVGAAVCGVVLAPLAVVSQRQSEQIGWLERPDWGTVGELVRLFAGPSAVVMGIFGVLVALGLAAAPWRARGRLHLAAVAAPLAVLPPAVLLLASQQQPMYHERYVLFALPGVPLLAAAGLDRIGAAIGAAAARVRWLRPASWALGPWALGPWVLGPWVLGAAVLLGAVLPQLPQQRELRTVQARPDDLAAVARLVRDRARPGDGVLFLPSKYRAVALGYPEAFRGLDDVALERTPVRAANLRGAERSKRGTRNAMLAADRLWVIGRTDLRVRSGEGGALNKEQVLREFFRAAGTVRVHGLEVRLYERKPEGS